MDKRIKKALTKNPLSMYNCEWVEKAATDGFKNILETWKKINPEDSDKMEENTRGLAIIYYMAFEDALNTFFVQALDDTTTEVELCLNELNKITVEFKKLEKKKK